MSKDDQDWMEKLDDETRDRLRRRNLDYWWGRNFYPHVSMLLNDLHDRGLLAPGEYTIIIDW